MPREKSQGGLQALADGLAMIPAKPAQLAGAGNLPVRKCAQGFVAPERILDLTRTVNTPCITIDEQRQQRLRALRQSFPRSRHRTKRAGLQRANGDLDGLGKCLGLGLGAARRCQDARGKHRLK